MTPEQTNELFRSLGRIESRLDAWDDQLSRHMAADEAAAADLVASVTELEKRVVPVEKFMWKAAGAFAVLSVAASEVWRRVFP
jgi:hypothetical protein